MDKNMKYLRTVGTGVLTDVLTMLNTGEWTLGIHPSNPGMAVAGRAFTVRYGYLDEGQKYTPIFHLFEQCKPGDVMVIDASLCKGAMLGEHVIHAAANSGLGGVVADGVFRDIAGIRKMDIPTFCSGYEAAHCPKNFKPVEINAPIVAGGAKVNPGDFVVGDLDGVIFFDPGIIESVIFRAEHVARAEEEILEALNSGASMSDILRIGKAKTVLKEKPRD
jgi:regulator of RNase E activity RraA